uniref:Uncharacterized protein n=1 Tax=Sphaerodactylus townsendi TaxID=933632 RepID=A0ACB8G4X9_9SAUR
MTVEKSLEMLTLCLLKSQKPKGFHWIFKEENDMQRNNIYDLYNYNPVSGHVDGQKGEACTERDNFFPPVSYYASVISHLLSQPEASSGLDPAFLLPSSQKNELLFQSGGNNTFSKEASALSQLPFFGMSNSSQFGNEHLQAKRARVENIIRGMNIMPSSIVPGTFGESGEHHTEKEKNYRENKRKQKLPHQQSPHETPPVRPGKSNIRADEHLQRKKQLHVLQHQMKQLGKKFLQPCSDACQNQRSMEKTVHLLKEKLGQCLDDGNQAILSDQNQNPLWRLIPKEEGSKLSEKEAAMMGSSIPTSEDNTLSEILKHELIQEALTPGHLRKAKLMFFFTRYPSSSLLKAYFLDVQVKFFIFLYSKFNFNSGLENPGALFTRCITSQLIKWFSNFREFYYIQMEKFARQALLDGITDPNDLLISRDSELFRILNTHYNKGNDFEVPDGFLDVASLTLQEFFGAIRGGKDLDPSWKKPIYKIISKLDSKIPDTFKSSSCLQETVQG